IWWDHHGHAVADAFSCKNCHHNTLKRDGQHVTALRAKREWTAKAGAIQSCRNCHGKTGPVAGTVAEGSKAPSTIEVFKKICIECHKRLGGGPQSWEAYFLEPVIEEETVAEPRSEPAQERAP
ncbi:MAG: cytochrome c3 family protein, partial [Acidobacteriota bacterium]